MNRCCYPTTFLNGLCARTDTRDHKGQRLRKTSFYGVVHMKKNKQTNKLKNVFNHLQLGHVPLTFSLQADSQLKFGRRGLAGGGDATDGKHTRPSLPAIVKLWWQSPRDGSYFKDMCSPFSFLRIHWYVALCYVDSFVRYSAHMQTAMPIILHNCAVIRFFHGL